MEEFPSYIENIVSLPKKKYENQELIRRRIDMTKLGQLYEKEKIEYGNERAKKAALMEKYTIAQNLLVLGLDIVDIMEVTGLTEAEILSLKAKQII